MQTEEVPQQEVVVTTKTIHTVRPVFRVLAGILGFLQLLTTVGFIVLMALGEIPFERFWVWMIVVSFVVAIIFCWAGVRGSVPDRVMQLLLKPVRWLGLRA